MTKRELIAALEAHPAPDDTPVICSAGDNWLRPVRRIQQGTLYVNDEKYDCGSWLADSFGDFLLIDQ